MLEEGTMNDVIIVSRHQGAVEWVRATAPQFGTAPVITGNATESDVKGKVVVGNVPLHLACLAREVVAIEFTGAPPRGAEYGVAEMEAAGARLARYVVRHVPEGQPAPELFLTVEEARQGGYCC